MTTFRGTIIAGWGQTYDHLRIEGERLTFSPAPPGGDSEVITGWVLPGLVDVHCHIGFSPRGVVDESATRSQAHLTTQTGVLLIRDAGMPIDTRFLDAESYAPRIIRAGQHIARPKRYTRELPVNLEDPDNLPQALASQALAGDGWVKVVGDWIDRDLGERADLKPLWTPQQLAAGFNAARNNGARVMVHTFAQETITPLLDAGVDCIEHGCGMTTQHMNRAASEGIAVTPTLVQVENFPAIADQAEPKYPLYAAHMRRLYDNRFSHVQQLYEAGVQLLVGSDAGGGIPHGSFHNEIDLLRHAGIPDDVIVGAASYQARQFLGVPGISEGAPADVVVYPEDPRRNAGILRHPIAIFKNGQRLH